METILRHLCQIHDLHALTVNYQHKFNQVTVYPHFEHDGDQICASGSAENFDEAFTAAMVEVQGKRDNAAEDAWQRHQEALMESGGPDNSAYRRDMIAAGRGHLLTEA